MWQRIEKEKKAAEHLLYVSLKYTKTCDVILNLISRWQDMIEVTIDALLNKLKKKRLIKEIPIAPKAKVNLLSETIRKDETLQEVLKLYLFFKKIKEFEQVHECEFRKNVALKIIDGGNVIVIDIEKLKEWNELLERFLAFVKQFIK